MGEKSTYILAELPAIPGCATILPCIDVLHMERSHSLVECARLENG